MNNKGLTLVEVLAVLVILSIVAVVVTPNIAQNLVDYKDRLTETQLSSIKGATKNWVADNVDKVTCTENNTSALSVSVKELQDGAYLDENMKNPQGGKFDDSDAFGLVSCEEVKDETANLDSNYKYTYGAYLDINDYVKKMAIEYIKDNFSQIDNPVTVSTLQSNGYVYQSIRNTSSNVVSIPNSTIKVTAEDTATGEYEYSATIQ